MTCGIYKIENKLNHHIYIGQSLNIEIRLKNHKSGTKQVVDKAIQKYGVENFTFEIIEECLPSELNEREIYWINYYNSYNDGYNCTLGGNQVSIPQKLDQNKIIKIIWLLQNTILTNKEIAKLYFVSENMISGINTGYYWKQENLSYPIRKPVIKEKKSQSNNKYPDKEELEQIIKKYNGNFTKIGELFGVTDNAVRKVCKKYGLPYHSSDYKKKKIKQNTISNKSIKIAQYDLNGNLIKTFDSIALAEQETHIFHIREASNPNKKGRQTAGGYIWKRI